MSSWSSSHAAPPKSVRSRSPSRNAYGRTPYPDSSYPPDSYHREWDTYSRERAWADYERDKAAYDYGRRGRSRSPQYDDVGRKRRRSMSPYDRDRYDRRPRYDDYDAYRGPGHSPSRGRGPYGHSTRSSRAPVDPHTLDYPASLKQFADWFRYFHPQEATDEDAADKAAEQEAGNGLKPRNGIKARWEKYKKDFLAQQLQTLFEHHRKSPWFAEKYDPAPEFVALRARVRKVGWRGRMNQFLNDLETGKFDREGDSYEAEQHEPVQTAKDSPVPEDGAVEDGESPSKAEEDFSIGFENDEEAADNAGDVKNDTNGKASYESKQTERDEVSVIPEGNQVMIRTIPPDIGRAKLEAVLRELNSFVYLALGDPMQKRNYYRAGWIKFDEHADMPNIISSLGEKKIEGFKLHLNHNIQPFTGKVRTTPEVASRPDRIAKDLAQARRLTSVLEDEYERVRTFKPEPSPAHPDGAEGGDAPPPEDVLMRDAVSEDEPTTEKGSDALERRIAHIVSQLPEPTNDAEAEALEVKKNTIALDLYLAYLRAAFHTCYYCVCTCDHIEELQRKCIKHVRKPLPRKLASEGERSVQDVPKTQDDVQEGMKLEGQGKATEESMKNEKDDERKEDKNEAQDKIKESLLRERDPKGGESRESKRNEDRWVEWLDTKIAVLINRDGIDVRDYGGKRYEDELLKAVEPHIKQEDLAKFRCKMCSKIFKAVLFVGKHVANKHPELVKQLEDLPYYNNFALDPQRIQPFTHYPQQVGNGPAPPPQAYGFRNAPQAYPDYGRGPPAGMAAGPGGPYYGFPAPYPPYANGGPDPYGAYPYGYAYPSAPVPPQPRNLRDEPPLSAGNGGGRRLGDRIGGFVPDSSLPGHGIVGLPAKPTATLEPGPGGRRNGAARVGAPPPPPDAKEDPRAAAGRKVSYHDMDLVAEGDVELNY